MNAVFIMILVLSGMLEFSIDFNAYMKSRKLWLTNILSFLMFGIAVVVLIGAILDELRRRNEKLNDLNAALKKEIEDKNKAEEDRRTLSGFIPICSNCHQIRNDKGYWTKLEQFIRDNSEADFTHSICPGCAKKMYPEIFEGE